MMELTALLANQAEDKSLLLMDNVKLAQTIPSLMDQSATSSLDALQSIATLPLNLSISMVLAAPAQRRLSLTKITPPVSGMIAVHVIERMELEDAFLALTTLMLTKLATFALLMSVTTSLITSTSMDPAKLAMLTDILIQSLCSEAALRMTALMELTISCNGVTKPLAEPTQDQIVIHAKMPEAVSLMSATTQPRSTKLMELA
jgi:hypothetical protein